MRNAPANWSSARKRSAARSLCSRAMPSRSIGLDGAITAPWRKSGSMGATSPRCWSTPALRAGGRAGKRSPTGAGREGKIAVCIGELRIAEQRANLMAEGRGGPKMLLVTQYPIPGQVVLEHGIRPSEPFRPEHHDLALLGRQAGGNILGDRHRRWVSRSRATAAPQIRHPRNAR